MEIVQWLAEQYEDVFYILAGLLGVAQIVVRLFPTIDKDGFVTRLGKWLDTAMDSLKIPNPKKK